MRESSWRIAPAAALRGLTYSFCAGRALALVQRLEVAAVHQHFAAHLEVFDALIFSGMERTVRRLAVTSSPVVPSPRVAPCDENAVPVGQAHGQAVELGLDRVLELFDAEVLPHPLVEGAHLLLVESVADGQHRRAMAHLAELGERRGADALGRRIRRAQLGMAGFELLQLAKQRVVLGVGDFRCVFDVVQPVVALDLLCEGF